MTSNEIFNKIPNEIINEICKYLDIPSLSRMLCTNKRLYTQLNTKKWDIIDIMNTDVLCKCVPRNKETFMEYEYCIDLTEAIVANKKLDDTTIINLNQYINFGLLSTNQRLSHDILRKYYDCIPITNLLRNQKLPYDILVHIAKTYELNNTQWYELCKNQPIDETFIIRHYKNINWNALSQNRGIITIGIISRFTDQLFWPELTNLGLSEDIINKCMDKIESNVECWSNICFSSRLSSEFILRHMNKLNAMILLTCQTLEEPVILELINNEPEMFREDLWIKVATSQNLSKEFIQQYRSSLPLRFLIRNRRIKRKMLRELFN